MKLEVIKIPERVIPADWKAGGALLIKDVSEFAEPFDVNTIFRRLMQGHAFCEMDNPAVGDMSPLEVIARMRTIELNRVCGAISDAHVEVRQGKVLVFGDFTPTGPLADQAREIMSHGSLNLGARFIKDGDGKITSVEAWDVVAELAE